MSTPTHPAPAPPAPPVKQIVNDFNTGCTTTTTASGEVIVKPMKNVEKQNAETIVNYW